MQAELNEWTQLGRFLTNFHFLENAYRNGLIDCITVAYDSVLKAVSEKSTKSCAKSIEAPSEQERETERLLKCFQSFSASSGEFLEKSVTILRIPALIRLDSFFSGTHR